jgi:hypothetical protein
MTKLMVTPGVLPGLLSGLPQKTFFVENNLNPMIFGGIKRSLDAKACTGINCKGLTEGRGATGFFALPLF